MKSIEETIHPLFVHLIASIQILMKSVVFQCLLLSIILYHSCFIRQYSFSYPKVIQIPYHIVPFNLSLFEKRNDGWIRHCRNKAIVPSINYQRSLSSVILFIVNHHYSSFYNTSFFDNQYFPSFCSQFDSDFDYVFIGPKENSINLVLSNELPERGYYSYMSLNRVLDRFSRTDGFDYKGYFLINDDSCIDPHQLNAMNLSSSFTEGRISHPLSEWVWTRRKNERGIMFCDALSNATNKMRLKYPEYGECLESKNQMIGWSDAFYVHSRDVNSVSMMFEEMYSDLVFLEMAVPVVMNCLNAKVIPSCNHGCNKKRTSYHLHPVKYSSNENQIRCINRMLRMDSEWI